MQLPDAVHMIFFIHKAVFRMKHYLNFITFMVMMSGTFTGLSQQFPEEDISISPSIQYGQESLRWSVAGDTDGQNPNILSELIWKKLQGVRAGLTIRKRLSGRFSVQADMSYMGIASGGVSDTDYRADNRQDISYEERLRSDKGYVLSFDAVVQYDVYRVFPMVVTTFVGFTNSYQHLFMLDNAEALVEGKTLKTTYTPHWYGATAGGRFTFYVGKTVFCLEFSGDLMRYAARANWNLREEFAHPVSFKHRATGYGVNGALRIAYPLWTNVHITFNAGMAYADTGDGEDKTFYANGKQVYTMLNGVVRRSYHAGIGLKIDLPY